MRISYEKMLRDAAKKLDKGLFAIDIVYPGGHRTTLSGLCTDEECGELVEAIGDFVRRRRERDEDRADAQAGGER